MDRQRVQSALESSNANRSALDDRIATLNEHLKAIDEAEEESRMRKAVISCKERVENAKARLVNAQLVLATTMIANKSPSQSALIQARERKIEVANAEDALTEARSAFKEFR